MANTGYKVTLYIDDNPNSSGYGQTWTEREWDASHCPVDGHWTEITSLCEATTSGYTGYKTTVYYNELTGQYSSTTVFDSSCPNSSMAELWIDSGDPYCEMDEQFLYTGYQVQHQIQRNSNLLNYGEERDERTSSSACTYTIEPVWEEIYRTCHVIVHEATGELTFDGTAEVLQIDVNPSSPTYNQTRTVVEESEECNYVQCEETTNEWVYQGDYCGSAIPEEWFSGATPDTLYEVYRLYINCLVNGEVIKSSPTDYYSGVTSETGVTDCVERWVETDETVCQYSNEYSGNYLTFVALDDCTFTYEKTGNNNHSIKYSLNDGATWTTLNTGGTTPTVSSGQKILWKGNYTIISNSWSHVGKFSSTGRFNVEGNPQSLYFGDDFEGVQTPVGFEALFNGTDVVSAENLALVQPLMDYCYLSMFEGCTSLVTAPQLPVATLDDYCYGNMFRSCTALTTAPELPAVTLANGCYGSMFEGCTSLVNAPELPATTLANFCCSNMFKGCTSLVNAPSVLPASSMVYQCYQYMFSGCTSLVNAPEILATTCYDADACCYEMFHGCTSLTKAPSILPATTLSQWCYYGMFWDCSSLETAPELPATTLQQNCYTYMFMGCTSLNYIKALFKTTPSYQYMNAWVSGVSATGTFVKNSEATWNPERYRGDNGVPNNWTVQNI